VGSEAVVKQAMTITVGSSIKQLRKKQRIFQLRITQKNTGHVQNKEDFVVIDMGPVASFQQIVGGSQPLPAPSIPHPLLLSPSPLFPLPAPLPSTSRTSGIQLGGLREQPEPQPKSHLVHLRLKM